ncbi:tonB-linked outer membrane protein SusC/RagA family [Bacteroides sp. CAG:770]|nr:tonB-linked outer membrane protein SusC/RagA family [Bacteroides sp. CAG:770]
MFKHLKQTFLRVCVALIAAATLNVAAPFSAYAQNTSGKGTVKGIITDSNGPVPGAAVMIKDKTGAVISGMDGDYTLSGLEMNDVIVVTILGYKDAQAVWTGQQKLNFTLEVSTEFLDEVVVTALGIKREEKTLSYNVQKVDSDKLTTVKDANFVNSLVGKVAGVQINSGASGPGSTTRVVMRGMKSIEKNNTVLYVIDGVPMYNKSFGGSGGTMSSMVSSESAADINPEDIESVNMLTGPSAAALYGSEAANGVIIINTKKGAEGTTKVTVSNNTTFSRAYMMPDMQDRYGRSGGYNSWVQNFLLHTAMILASSSTPVLT